MKTKTYKLIVSVEIVDNYPFCQDQAVKNLAEDIQSNYNEIQSIRIHDPSTLEQFNLPLFAK